MFNTYDKKRKQLEIKTEIPYFCEKYFQDSKKKCQKFYENINVSSPSLIQCPYGFSCLASSKDIYTSLIVQGNSNLSKVKTHLETYNQKINDFTCYSQSQLTKIINSKDDLEDTSDIYSQTVHDIKNANKSMIDLSEAIERNETIQEILHQHADLYSLVEGYNLIKYRLDYHDWALQSIPYTKRCCSINLHKIITKLKFQLKYRALKKNITLQIEGYSYNNFHQHVSLFLGYFLLLENAIKYSLPYDIVTIKISDITSNETSIQIKNNCIALSNDEIPQLKTKGFRSKSAISSANGKGLGLNLADNIFSDAQSQLTIIYEGNPTIPTHGVFTASTTIKNFS